MLTAAQRDLALMAAVPLAGGVAVLVARARMAAGLRPLLIVYNGFYILTSVIGASLIADDDGFALWRLTLPTMDAGWLVPGEDWIYWVAVLGPLLVTNAVAVGLAPRLGAIVASAAARVRLEPAFGPCLLAAVATVGYCVFNLASHGYLGVGLYNPEYAGAYTLNVQTRAAMMATLGDMHYGLVYMAIPAICIVAFWKASESRAGRWWALFVALCGALVFLYLSTLTKGNLMVFAIALAVAAYTRGSVGGRGLAFAGLGGAALLVAQEVLLGGGSTFALARTVADVIFRISSGIPFYLGIFPDQHAYVGIDVGLSFFGIGPEQAANIIVADRMFPADTWVQGAVPAPAHVMAYAQGGLPWSLATMALIGVLIAGFSGLGRQQRNALVASAFVGSCLACYDATQTDLAGVFMHSYGLRWWAAGLLAIVAIQMVLALAARGRSSPVAVDR